MTNSYASSSGFLLLCPGQGAQHGAMFDLARSQPQASALLERLAPALPARDGDLFANRTAQPLVVAATLAMWEALRADAPPPALVAGYSIGELAAYGVAGAFSAEQTVALAHLRAQAMDDCLSHHPGQALVTISGLMVQQAVALAADHDFVLSIETGDDSCITGGPAEKAEALAQAVMETGGRPPWPARWLGDTGWPSRRGSAGRKSRRAMASAD